jgi:hypothetical protein
VLIVNADEFAIQTVYTKLVLLILPFAVAHKGTVILIPYSVGEGVEMDCHFLCSDFEVVLSDLLFLVFQRIQYFAYL